jgi:hypothetical protein
MYLLKTYFWGDGTPRLPPLQHKPSANEHTKKHKPSANEHTKNIITIRTKLVCIPKTKVCCDYDTHQTYWCRGN